MTNLYRNFPRRHKQLIFVISLFIGALFIFPSENATASRQYEEITPLALKIRHEVELELPESDNTPIFQASQQAPQLSWQTIRVKSGDNLAKIFKRAGFSARTLHDISRLDKQTASLKKIMPGQELKFGANTQGELAQLIYQLDLVRSLEITLEDGNYKVETIQQELETREHFVSAEIHSNFWNAGISAGLTPAQIVNLAHIFSWDIDFGLDIRKSDSFSLIFEKRYLDGIEVNTGNILAAEFVNQGKSYQAIRHDNGEYYNQEGRSMRKAFLRAPVNFKYISSSFNPRRLHPVTKRVRPHNGIDYAAKTGTPVVASGNGKVIASAYSKYNGNYIFIKHGEKYVTKYLHLSKKMVKKGQKVKQGQLIGKVGATGRVTGAHLHYEFLVNGVHRNPRTVKLPQPQSINAADKKQFLAIANERMAELTDGKRVALAMR